MSISRTKALEYAYELISVPACALAGASQSRPRKAFPLRYRGRVMTKVYMNRSGNERRRGYGRKPSACRYPNSAKASAPLVSTGALYRVLALSELDYRKPESFEVAARLIDDAIDQRGGVQGRHLTGRDLPRAVRS